MKIRVLDFLEAFKEETFDLYYNGILVGENVEYYDIRQKFNEGKLGVILDRAVFEDVVKVEFLKRVIFVGEVN